MPRPEPGKRIYTQFGRVVYDRKPKPFTYKDAIRIGKKLNFKFWSVPGRFWFDFVRRLLDFVSENLDLGIQDIFGVFEVKTKGLEPLPPEAIEENEEYEPTPEDIIEAIEQEMDMLDADSVPFLIFYNDSKIEEDRNG